MIYDNILGTIGRTPVVRIQRLAPSHATMFVKCEFFNPLASVKDRLAIAVIEHAERTGALTPGQTVVEATSGNTGIALAMVCAVKGYPFVATMAETFSVERRKIIRMLGGTVILTPAAERGMGMVRKAEELARKHGWFLARQFENEANPAYHRNTTGPEILSDFAGKRLDYFVTGWGTGGTLTGAGQMIRLARPDVQIIATRARRRRAPLGQAVDPAQDPGMDARLRAGRPRPDGAASCPAGDGRRGHRHGAGARAPRGNFLRHLLRRNLRRGPQGRGRGAGGLGHPRNAAGHRRALSLHGAVRGNRRRQRSGTVTADRLIHGPRRRGGARRESRHRAESCRRPTGGRCAIRRSSD